MRKAFEYFLESRGYSKFTASGAPSTVYDYIKRIDKVCYFECCTWEELSENIDAVICDYDIGGEKEHIGNISHRAVINALKRFREFVDYQKIYLHRQK